MASGHSFQPTLGAGRAVSGGEVVNVRVACGDGRTIVPSCDFEADQRFHEYDQVSVEPDVEEASSVSDQWSDRMSSPVPNTSELNSESDRPYGYSVLRGVPPSVGPRMVAKDQNKQPQISNMSTRSAELFLGEHEMPITRDRSSKIPNRVAHTLDEPFSKVGPVTKDEAGGRRSVNTTTKRAIPVPKPRTIQML